MFARRGGGQDLISVKIMCELNEFEFSSGSGPPIPTPAFSRSVHDFC